MKIEQFADYIKPHHRVNLENENEKYQAFLISTKMAYDFLRSIGHESSDLLAFHNAAIQVASVSHKICCAFQYGYLALNDGRIGNEDERIALYTEIAEYLELVAAGIDSFVATHPIKAIEEGGTDDE